MKKFFLLFTALCIFSGFAASGVSALDLRLENTFDSKLDVAVVYFDSKHNAWRTRGWYTVDPHRTRTITFNSSKKTVYFHSQLSGSKLRWGKGDLIRVVRSDAFSYLDGESCPAGKKRREVKFTKYTTNKKGVINYKPQQNNSKSNSKKEPLKKAGDSGSLRPMEIELLRLINVERKKIGVGELRLDNALMAAARQRAKELQKKYSHTRPDGRSYHTVMSEHNLKPSSSAENIAWASGGEISASKFNKMFYNSAGHKKNMLNSQYSFAGIGFHKVGDKYYCAELFTGK